MNTREWVESHNPTFPDVIDATMLNSWKQCKHKCFREFFQGLTPNAISPDLHAGAAIALGIETVRKRFYTGDTLNQALIEGFLAFTEYWGDYGPPENHNKSFIRCACALIAYFDEYNPGEDIIQPYMSDGEPAVEFTFALPIDIAHPETGDPLFYAGRFDMLGIYQDSMYDVDEKTTKALGASWAKKWDLRSQFIGYNWASHQMNFPVVGTITRGIGILKTDITFMPVICLAESWKIEQWYEIMIAEVDAMVVVFKNMELFDDKKGFRKNFDESCTAYGGCPFKTLCMSKNPEPWLNDYDVRTWNPLAKEPSQPVDTSEG